MDYLQEKYFDPIEFELVVYDEIEKFRGHEEEGFNYPFSIRKSKLATY